MLMIDIIIWTEKSAYLLAWKNLQNQESAKLIFLLLDVAIEIQNVQSLS